MGNNPVGMTPAKGSFQGGGMMNTPGRNDSSFGGGNSLGLSGVQLQVGVGACPHPLWDNPMML